MKHDEKTANRIAMYLRLRADAAEDIADNCSNFGFNTQSEAFTLVASVLRAESYAIDRGDFE